MCGEWLLVDGGAIFGAVVARPPSRHGGSN
jgi:hypothetical protein